jgi:two-component system cell cycle response regulator
MAVHARQPEDTAPKVLVIDDSPDVHRLLKARLRYENLTLAAALSGAEGLAIARQVQPAIILLDLDMPMMDGFEALRELKENPATVDIPVIVLSGLHSPQDKVAAFDLGAVDYITKPFEIMELRVRVRAALRLQRLVRMLAQRAQIDGLTGLWNRAYFDVRWREEVAISRRKRRPLTLALCDLDHFKSVNDSFGHPAGDAVLQGVSELLQSELRESDVACRFGGEEVAIVMPETSAAEAMGVCDRIRDGLATLAWARHPDRQVTMSVGIVGSDGSARIDADQWLAMVDAALYDSKRRGRNCCTVREAPGDKPKVRKAG